MWDPLTQQYKILIVDDDLDDQEFIVEALKTSGTSCEILSLDNGREMINFLRKSIDENVLMPDAILLDVNMPVMNGLQALMQMHSEDLLKRIPVFIISTRSRNVDNIPILLGVTRVFEKPNNFSGYTIIINHVLNRLRENQLIIASQ